MSGDPFEHKYEVLHRSFLRSILGVRKGVPNELLYVELGRSPLFLKALDSSVSYLTRILVPKQIPDDRALFEAFLLDGSLKSNKSWIRRLVKLFNASFETNFVFSDPDDDMISALRQTAVSLAQILADRTSARNIVCLRPLRESCEHQRKLFFFRSIWEAEEARNFIAPYLTDTYYKHVRALASFRLSSHPLRIEMGCYEKPKLPRTT